MLICLRDVPKTERHLLFCTDPRLDGRPRKRRRRGRRRVRVGSPLSAQQQTADRVMTVPVATGFDAAAMTVGVA